MDTGPENKTASLAERIEGRHVHSTVSTEPKARFPVSVGICNTLHQLVPEIESVRAVRFEITTQHSHRHICERFRSVRAEKNGDER
jgi:hypothetical protein